MKKLHLSALACAMLLASTSVMAQDVPACTDCHVNLTPKGVMGDHLHKPGEYMLSYSFMRMEMDGNRNGTNKLTPQQVITFANPNAGPANLRVVPTEMTMDMHMVGGMVGITDWLTGMVMVNYLDNSMDHITFNMPGTAQIGTFTTESSGFGDTEIAGIMSLYKDGAHGVNATMGLSLPTGSIDEQDDVLAPNGTTPTLRLPYMMQLGSGTYDLKPRLTYTYLTNDWTYGAEYNARIHMGRNDEGYTRGDWHAVSTWAGYQFDEALGVSTSLSAKTEGKIDGADTQIAAPVQTADPDNYGGEKIHWGLNGAWKFHDQQTVKASLSIPLYQDLNGPQMEGDYSFSLRWQNSF
jgi:hypothetical protein